MSGRYQHLHDLMTIQTKELLASASLALHHGKTKPIFVPLPSATSQGATNAMLIGSRLPLQALPYSDVQHFYLCDPQVDTSL